MRCLSPPRKTRLWTPVQEDEQIVRRRRECAGCGKRFTTYEREELLPSVVKKDARREPFDRAKLLGVTKACEKRPVPCRARGAGRFHRTIAARNRRKGNRLVKDRDAVLEPPARD